MQASEGEGSEPRDPGATKDQLFADLKAVANDAEELLRATAGDLEDRTQRARERLQRALDRSRTHYRYLEGRARERVKITDQVIREHPYQAVFAGFGMGLIVGLFLRRR